MFFIDKNSKLWQNGKNSSCYSTHYYTVWEIVFFIWCACLHIFLNHLICYLVSKLCLSRYTKFEERGTTITEEKPTTTRISSTTGWSLRPFFFDAYICIQSKCSISACRTFRAKSILLTLLL